MDRRAEGIYNKLALYVGERVEKAITDIIMKEAIYKHYSGDQKALQTGEGVVPSRELANNVIAEKLLGQKEFERIKEELKRDLEKKGYTNVNVEVKVRIEYRIWNPDRQGKKEGRVVADVVVTVKATGYKDGKLHEASLPDIRKSKTFYDKRFVDKDFPLPKDEIPGRRFYPGFYPYPPQR